MKMKKMTIIGGGGKLYAFPFVGAIAMLCGTAFGVNTNTWISGSTDWSAAASYVENRTLSAGDVVVIPSGVTATVSVVSTEAANTEGSSFDVFSKLSRVLIDGTESGIILDVAEDVSVTNNCYIHAVNGSYKGTIIKRGLGMIEFGAQDYQYAYNLNLKVEQGVLVLPQERPTGIFYVGKITVDEGATLITAMNAARKGELSSSPTYCYELWGEGTISNRYNLSQRIDFREDGHTFTFGGVIGSGMRIFPHANVTALLTGTNSTFTYSAQVGNRATLGFMKLGKSKSSLGTYSTVYWRGTSGRLLYLGNGETSSKDIRTYSSSDVEHILDGGANGGLTLTGTLGFYASSDSFGMQRVTITGSNTVPCVIAGAIGGRTFNATNYYFHITKKGTGTWRLGDYERTYPNAWSVENGTLQFESLKEAGVPCSLGVATNLFESYSGLIDESKRVDWAFALGGASTRGTMEYVGSTDVSCTSRLVVVKGKGGAMKNSTARPMVFSGASAMDGEDSEFAVAGDNAAVTNFIRDVTDGKGTTSFAKEGDGTWVLSGDTSFSGSLAVRGGTLLVTDPTKYTWFRWSVTTNFEGQGRAQATELGIWDESGNRINHYLYPYTNYYSKAEGSLPVGMCAYWRPGTLSDTVSSLVRPIEGLFDDGTALVSGRAAYFSPRFSVGGEIVVMSSDDPSTWIPVVMHLTNGIGRAASFDLALDYGGASTVGRNVKGFVMEGSVDGICWNHLTNIVLESNVTSGTKWQSSGANYSKGKSGTHEGGWPIAGGPENAALALANVESVSVAAGARLVAWGGVAPIKGLTVDANGAGAIDGFGFAANGTLDIENMPAGGATLPGTYENCTGLENVANWSISVGGKHTARYKTTVSGGVLRVTAIGTAISIR